MEMADRSNIVKEFKSGSTRILVSTDLLGRGIDIQQVNLIINYDLPSDPAKYIHRIGRTGRFGRKGVAINLVTPGDADFIAKLKTFYNTQIDELPFDLSKIYEWLIVQIMFMLLLITTNLNIYRRSNSPYNNSFSLNFHLG